jgi:hypothetical protein
MNLRDLTLRKRARMNNHILCDSIHVKCPEQGNPGKPELHSGGQGLGRRKWAVTAWRYRVSF